MRPPLNRLSAAQLLRMIASREVTCEMVTHSFVDAVEQREDEVHAFAWIEPERALNIARGFDGGAKAGPLTGLPVAVKDVIDTAGIAYRARITDLRWPCSGADAACIAVMHAAGGYVFGKTVTAELANFTPGPTRNPHGLEHTPERIVERVRSGCRCAYGAVRTRYTNGRFGDSTGSILWSGGIRADARPGSARRRDAAVRHAGCAWVALRIRLKMQRYWRQRSHYATIGRAVRTSMLRRRSIAWTDTPWAERLSPAMVRR